MIIINLEINARQRCRRQNKQIIKRKKKLTTKSHKSSKMLKGIIKIVNNNIKDSNINDNICILSLGGKL